MARTPGQTCTQKQSLSGAFHFPEVCVGAALHLPLGSLAGGVAHLYSPATRVRTGFLQLHHYLVPSQVQISPFPASSETPSKLDSKTISLTFSQHKTFAYLVGLKMSVLLPCSSFVTILQCCLSSDICRICGSAEPHLKNRAISFHTGMLFPWLAPQQSGSILAQRHSPLHFSPKQSVSTAVHPPALSRTRRALKTH